MEARNYSMNVVPEEANFSESERGEPSISSESGKDPKDEEIARLSAERDNLVDRLARLQAEFENARKRAAKENLDHRDRVVYDTVHKLLPVIDNFDLALKADSPPEKLRGGVELIRRQMDEMLKEFGVQRIEAHGKPFDPHQHEAVEIVESLDHPENHVIEELRRGYRHKEKLLRPAMVRVTKNRKS